MPISSTLWSMWGVVLQKKGGFCYHYQLWMGKEKEKRERKKEKLKVWSCRREVSFFLHSTGVRWESGEGEEGGKRERYCESAVLQKRGVIFHQNRIGEKEKRDGRERESEMRKKRVKVSLTRIRMAWSVLVSNG